MNLLQNLLCNLNMVFLSFGELAVLSPKTSPIELNCRERGLQ